jgi:hypothetical protein
MVTEKGNENLSSLSENLLFQKRMMSKGTKTLVREMSAKADELEEIDATRSLSVQAVNGFSKQTTLMDLEDKIKKNFSKFRE